MRKMIWEEFTMTDSFPYWTMGGEYFDLVTFSKDQALADALRVEDPVIWLAREIVKATRWSEFQNSTADKVRSSIQRIDQENWNRHPFYLFHGDLVGQLGLHLGQLPPLGRKNTKQFLEFLAFAQQLAHPP